MGGLKTSSSVVLDLNTMQVCNNNYENFNDTDESYEYGIGAVLDKKYPVICLGFYNNEVVKNCRIFNHPSLTETPEFNEQRIGASGILWERYKLWVTGGVYATNVVQKNSRQISSNGEIGQVSH